MAEFVFNVELTDEEVSIFHSASMEWRKEIGMKGVAEETVKWKFIEIIERFIPDEYFNMTDDRMEVISAFAQPFFISPMINVSDILVGIADLYDIHETHVPPKTMIRHALIHHPPFPMLERRTGTNEQTFIMLISSKDTCRLCGVSNSEISPEMFGYGPRKCAGITIVHSMIERIVALISDRALEFHPERGNAYSGRLNDSSSTVETNMFLINTMFRVLLKG
jgi:hypothetical protein